MKPPPDWDAIKRDYQTGEYTVRELADRHGVPKSTIQRRINRDNWERDLTAQITKIRRAKVARVDAEEFAEEKRDKEAGQKVGQEAGQAEMGQVVPLTLVTEQAASRQVQVIRSHREKTKRLQRQADRQLDLIDMWLNGNETEQAEAARRLFVGKGDSLTAHLSAAMNIVDKVIRLERELYGLDSITSEMSLDKANALRDELERRFARIAST
jgi:transposase